MVVKQEVDVGVIRRFFFAIFCCSTQLLFAQLDSLQQFKKKVLNAVEVDVLMSYYEQDGIHAAVTGGLGNEYLTDYSPSIVIRMPVKEDAVLTADVGLSAYTSASSSNGNPFNRTGASSEGDEEAYGRGSQGGAPPQGSPWIASTGASRKDVLTTLNLGYQEASDDRNRYWGVNLGGSMEYDYESFSTGVSYAQLWNEKNTELSLKGQLYFDRWKPIIPTELHEYELFQETFLYDPQSYFRGVSIMDDRGNSVAAYLPSNFTSYTSVHRNSFAFSVGLSQVLGQRLQGAVFADLVLQEGLLSNPLQRVYFEDKADYYIGNFRTLGNYASQENTDLFHLADDVERLPSRRLKTPFGLRLNYYFNEYVVLRSYLRHYSDDWGIQSNTLQLELPIRFNLSWKFMPIYRYYDQTAARYFAPYNRHLSSSEFYTSDYDLATFNSHQWGFSLSYRAVFTRLKLFDFGLKSAQIRAQNYQRSDGLSAFVVSTAFLFVLGD
ncbi:MAG: DUF3570 domain-containing protein [Flavobacteriaceae bacterium]